MDTSHVIAILVALVISFVGGYVLASHSIIEDCTALEGARVGGQTLECKLKLSK